MTGPVTDPQPAPLPFGPWWDVYRRLTAGGSDFAVLPAAMAMAHILQGGQPWPEADDRLRDLERDASACAGGLEPADAASAVVTMLADAGFCGDLDNYEDPNNSFIDRVLERRRGLPIALSVLAIHLCRHVGVTLYGIGFPGHFIVGLNLSDPLPLVLDPFFEGRALTPEDLHMLLTRATGRRHPKDRWRHFVRPASGREIAMRMLRNLVLHLHRAEQPDHAAAAGRLLELTANPDPSASGHAPD